MIPGKIFTGFAKFQGIVSVNDFWLFGSKNFCKLLCVYCEVFLLHGYAWIHWVAKSCTTTAYRWLFRDSQPSLRTLWSAVIKSPNFSARGTTLPIRLLHGALVILVLWQISQFRSFGKWVWTLCLPKSTLLVCSKDGSWEELACESLRSGTMSSTRFYLNSWSHSGMSEYNGSLGFRFLFGFGFSVGLVNESPRSFRSTCELDTDAGSESVPHMSAFALVSLSLDTVRVGEVDELEEDVGWLISCLEGVMDVEEGKLEEELVDKPGTTIGTKFSVLHCIRIPFFMRCSDRWSIHMSIRVHRKAFLAIKLLAYPRGLSESRIYPILWRKLWPLHASALLHWLQKPSSDSSKSSRFPILRNSNPSCLSSVSTLRSLQQILFLLV